MTNWGFENNDDTQTGENLDGPKALRDAYNALKAQNDELNTKLTSFLADQEKAKKAALFANLGAPGAESLYQGDADPEKAKQWIDSMRSVFGGNAQGAPVTPVAETQPAMTPEQQASFQTMVNAGQNEVPLGNFEAAQTTLGSATTLDEIIAAMGKLQGGNG